MLSSASTLTWFHQVLPSKLAGVVLPVAQPATISAAAMSARRWCRESRMVSPLFRGVAPEEAVFFPLRRLRGVGDVGHQGADHVFIFAGGSEVDGLLEIVGRRVITMRQPFLIQRLLL